MKQKTVVCVLLIGCSIVLTNGCMEKNNDDVVCDRVRTSCSPSVDYDLAQEPISTTPTIVAPIVVDIPLSSRYYRTHAEHGFMRTDCFRYMISSIPTCCCSVLVLALIDDES